ncbi:hypothetical protein [Massilia forsythiae]|uniref:hypothetical protein n=1 Tax=Massilia forsythiae TaxID=2728020 RepID=UPI001B7CE847
MFDQMLFFASQHVRTGALQWWSEFVATFGLIGFIIGCSRSRPAVTPFANPAVTLARAATDTFAGIRPGAPLASS